MGLSTLDLKQLEYGIQFLKFVLLLNLFQFQGYAQQFLVYVWSSGQTLGVKAQRFRGHTSPHRNVKDIIRDIIIIIRYIIFKICALIELILISRLCLTISCLCLDDDKCIYKIFYRELSSIYCMCSAVRFFCTIYVVLQNYGGVRICVIVHQFIVEFVYGWMSMLISLLLNFEQFFRTQLIVH
eukprot:TRINITY_DN7390_c0_g1_i2.p1 TRINITY_DN7390_c0_g1~~TRINITY_DN7390_c0_g1_i2.p1  ORF type:complete len:198 (+),score=-3.74 TRINITY_DN7390_c0_g1_i2:48-596(+)